MNQVEISHTETQELQSPVRVGVVVCKCGDKIAGVIDTQALCQYARELPQVVYVTREAYPCSKDGQERLRETFVEQNLNRVLIAGCSPRLMRSLFRATGQSVGLARSFVNMANIREQCAYVHADDPTVASQKAAGLIEMGVARLATISAEQPRIGHVIRSALMIGSDISGLTMALALADNEIPVTLVEHDGGFGVATPDDLRKHTRQRTAEIGQTALGHPLIRALFNAQVTEVTGHPGDYTVQVQRGSQTTAHNVGAIIVTNAAQPKTLGDEHWFDRRRVKTQAEFEIELEEAAHTDEPLELNDIVMIFCAEETQRRLCTRVCCNIGIRQAIQAKRLNPDANVTILFRELYLGGLGGDPEDELIQARKMDVTLFRYRDEFPPVIGSHTIDIHDTLTSDPIRVPFDRVVLTMPLIPQDNAPKLAALLGLPLDEDGFLAEPRVRLRPGRYAEPGIYALGSAQMPADTDESLLQAYLTSSRVIRFLSQDTIKVETPVAQIDSALCTGCGNCTPVCPVSAIKLERSDGVLSLSEINELRCYGCGNCVVVCPVNAISLPGWDSVEIPIQIQAALQSPTFDDQASKIMVIACEWSAYGAADLAGARRFHYSPNVRIIRTNCSARFDPFHILWAFLHGADGVLLGACPSGECHYGSGNLFARERVEALQKTLAEYGIDPRRLRLEFFSVDDGNKFARLVNDFERKLSEIVNSPDSRVG
jgi:heterodisulfide reductase subunit A